MDKKDVFAFFLELRTKLSDNELVSLFENYDITKLDINRIYRYLDKYTKVDFEVDEVIDDKSVDCNSDIDD